MKCKFCFAELEEDAKVCPMCGKQLDESAEEEQIETATKEAEELEDVVDIAEEESVEDVEGEETAEEAPAKKKKKERKPLSKGVKITLAVVGAVALLAILAATVVFSLKLNLKPYNSPVCYKTDYKVSETIAQRKNANVVATMADQQLTNGQMQIYYQFAVTDYINTYESTLAMMGLDTSLPFEDQQFTEEKTFQHMFLENALESWRRQVTLVQMAEEAGFELGEEDRAELDAFRKQLDGLAVSNGYENADEYISEILAPGSTADDLMYYNEVYYLGSAYYLSICDTMAPTDDELEAYFAENEKSFTSSGIVKDDDVCYYDVRHILLQPTGDPETEEGYSEAQWEACLQEAENLLNTFLGGSATEAEFAALAAAHSVDTGSSGNGGLYTTLTAETNFVEEFVQWYVDPTLQPGDTGIIRTDYGYHIMYLSAKTPIWRDEATTAYMTDELDKILDDAKIEMPMEVDYTKVALGF